MRTTVTHRFQLRYRKISCTKMAHTMAQVLKVPTIFIYPKRVYQNHPKTAALLLMKKGAVFICQHHRSNYSLHKRKWSSRTAIYMPTSVAQTNGCQLLKERAGLVNYSNCARLTFTRQQMLDSVWQGIADHQLLNGGNACNAPFLFKELITFQALLYFLCKQNYSRSF